MQIAGAVDLLLQVAERAEIPVAHTLLGIGNIDETHRLSAGYAGMHGWMHANKAIQQCDLLIGIGCRYDDRITGKTSDVRAERAKIVHVDVDRSEIGKNVRTDLGIVADAGDLLAALLRRLPQSEPRDRVDGAARRVARGQRGSVVARLRGVARGPALRRLRGRPDRRVATGHEATLVSDVGQNQMWAARYFGFRHPYRHLSSGGLGTMGYSVPAAMGAALGAPERETWAITGDGGFQMTMQELATLVQDQIPVRIAVLNNHRLGMIRQWQEIIYDENYHSAELIGPDLVRLCEAYGIPAWRATKPEEVDRGHRRSARQAPGPALIDFHLDEAQNVYPDDAARQGPLRHGRGRGRMTVRAPRPTTIPAGEPDAVQRRHVVSALVIDRPGTLNRVSGLLRARSFNIESLTVGATHEPGRSRMTIAIRGDDGHLRQVLAQLERVIDVLEVEPTSTRRPHVERRARPGRARRRRPMPRPSSAVRLAIADGRRRAAHDRCVRLAGVASRPLPDRLDRGPRDACAATACAASCAPERRHDHPETPHSERSDPVMTKLIYDADIDRAALWTASAWPSSATAARARRMRATCPSRGVDVVVGLRPGLELGRAGARGRAARDRCRIGHRRGHTWSWCSCPTPLRRRSITPRSSRTCATGRS